MTKLSVTLNSLAQMMRSKVVQLKKVNPDFDSSLLGQKAIGLSESAAAAANAEARNEVIHDEAKKHAHIQTERYRLRINKDAVAKYKKEQKERIMKAKENGEEIIIV